MAIELNFVKSDNDSWGFRLTGGAEYDVPLTVVNVTEGSIAEKGGLRTNDIIVRVNDAPTAGLTHYEAHDLLIAAKNNLILAVRRDLSGLVSPTTYDDENNEEVSNIMQAYIEKEEQFEHERQVHFEIINPEEEVDSLEETQEVLTQTTLENQTQVSTQNQISNIPERQWSTFLQKPKNPKPIMKKNDDVPKGEAYRVIIKKQKKKSPEEIQKRPEEAEDKCSHEIVEEQVAEESQESINIIMDSSTSNVVEEEIEFRAEIREEEEIQIEDNSSTEENINTRKESLSNEHNKEKQTYDATDRLLEEKLAEVQRQLEALSKLPSTIQSTIDAVTKQLATIVSIRSKSVTESEENVMSDVASNPENELEDQTIMEESCMSEIEEEVIMENEEQSGEKDDEKEDNEEQFEEDIQENRKDLQEETEETNDEILDPDSGLTEAEREFRRVEQEQLGKQQKEREKVEEFMQRRLKQKPTLPLKPIERPIILPGGRRWSQPDDACPTVRHPKMTDEKIAGTIETYSEVIVGKMKGINFMKYQPPPKNLDYLQRSDVYKLVHDLEPPIRGISSRVSKILAEQDYYEVK
ncbi:probable inactive protein kinase DDB_G0270444 isoform X1 [Tenebrio molitor]|uniref:probable inactive protein kinase DDB_G0270444 isoform X1 n=1 Tax=Tenebrio molitor TaxID=7067 RepID=UPI003624A1EE